MSICGDFLVELRGFEPMAIAGTVRSPAIRLFTSQCARWFLANYEDPVKSTHTTEPKAGISINAAGGIPLARNSCGAFMPVWRHASGVDDLEETKIASTPDAC